jgi:hypothetical protein
MGKWHTLEQIFCVSQPSDIAARRMMISKIVAIMGEKSMKPIRGINWRIGARIGSVISWTIV